VYRLDRTTLESALAQSAGVHDSLLVLHGGAFGIVKVFCDVTVENSSFLVDGDFSREVTVRAVSSALVLVVPPPREKLPFGSDHAAVHFSYL